MTELSRTPLHDLHQSHSAKMIPFAGYDMPVQYALGVMKEHLHTRQKAGLFDVSHMGQVELRGGSYAEVARALETLVPVDVLGLSEGRQRYGFFTNDTGGILDDLMLANRGDHVFMVVNAACKGADLAHLRGNLQGIDVIERADRALLALQGPLSEKVLAQLDPRAAGMSFMDVATLDLDGTEAWVSRSGYTGEDGYEISIPADQAVATAERLLAHADVEPIGLGARDSLRLEAGLCLYGHDIDTTTTPIEAGLTWAIQKVRRAGGDRAGGFPGAATILGQIENGVPYRRVGLRPEGRAPMREGVELYASEDAAAPVGRITSGGFGPTAEAPVAMGYLPQDLCSEGSRVFGALRGKRLPLTVTPLPFVPANFKR